MQGLGRRWTRRDAIRWSAGAGVLGGVVLSGCASGASAGSTAQQAAPTAASGVINLLFNPNVQGVGYNTTVHKLLQQYVDQNFNQNPKYKGINAQMTGALGQGKAAGQVAASIAGSGFPDVLEGCCTDFPTYFGGGWLVPLDGYLKNDNIDTSIWSKRHMEALNVDGQQLGIPSYDGSVCVVYRQDTLDQLGLSYPDSSWDFSTALDIWTRCTAIDPSTQKQRSGISVYLSSGDYWQKLNFWLRGWGATEADSTATHCTANSQNGINCLTFVQSAAKEKIILPRQDVGALTSGAAVFSMCGEWDIFSLAQQLGTKYKWNVLPVPTWPAGQRSTYNNIDFYGINRASKHPAHAWELLRWLTAEPGWQQFQIKATLVAPCLLQLWDQWETIVKQAAPPLQTKNLHWFRDAVVQGYSWPATFFRYNMNEVIASLDAWVQKIWSSQISPTEGLNQMVTQVNAIEAVGPAEAQGTSQATKLFPSNGPGIAVVQPGL